MNGCSVNEMTGSFLLIGVDKYTSRGELGNTTHSKR